MGMFKTGDLVVKNPEGWHPSPFDLWGAGEGIGVVVDDMGGAPDGFVDVRWPTGRAYQNEYELLAAPSDPGMLRKIRIEAVLARMVREAKNEFARVAEWFGYRDGTSPG